MSIRLAARIHLDDGQTDEILVPVPAGALVAELLSAISDRAPRAVAHLAHLHLDTGGRPGPRLHPKDLALELLRDGDVVHAVSAMKRMKLESGSTHVKREQVIVKEELPSAADTPMDTAPVVIDLEGGDAPVTQGLVVVKQELPPAADKAPAEPSSPSMVSFLVRTTGPGQQQFEIKLPSESPLSELRKQVDDVFKCAFQDCTGVALFTDRHPLAILAPEAETQSLGSLHLCKKRSNDMDAAETISILFAQPLTHEAQNFDETIASHDKGANSFHRAFISSPAWQPFQKQQTDVGMSCFLSSAYVLGKSLVTSDTLRRKLLGHFRAVCQFPPAVSAMQAILAGRPGQLGISDKAALAAATFSVLRGILPSKICSEKMFEHSRIFFSMLIVHAMESDSALELWKTVPASMDTDQEMEEANCDWLQAAEEEQANELEGHSGSEMVGRAWLIKRRPFLNAAWKGCSEGAIWLGPASTSEVPVCRSCLFQLDLLKSECGCGEAEALRLVAAQALACATPPCLTRIPDGKTVVFSGMPPCSAGEILIFAPLDGSETAKDPHRLAREVKRQGMIDDDGAPQQARAAAEAVVVCLDISQSMSGSTGFPEDTVETESTDDSVEVKDVPSNGWDTIEPVDDSSEALQAALRRFKGHPSFADFRAALLEGPGAHARMWWQTEGMAKQILLQVLLLENGKKENRDANFVRLCTKHQSLFIETLTKYLPAREGTISSTEAPQEFLCSISLEIMADPVVAADGFSYERESILDWFRTGNPPRSPMTGMILQSSAVTSNQNLKAQIAAWREGSTHAHQTFPVFCRGRCGFASDHSRTLRVWPGATAEDLKEQLAVQARVPAAVVKLSFQGRSLQDGLALVEHYGVARDQTIDVSVDLCNWQRYQAEHGACVAVTVKGRGETIKLSALQSTTVETLLLRLWAFSLCSTQRLPSWEPSNTTLWHGLEASGDGMRCGHPMDLSSTIGSKATRSGYGGRFLCEVEFEALNLHKPTKEHTGKSLTRLACVKQLFEAFVNRIQAYHLPTDVGLVVFNQSARLACPPTAFSEDFRDEVTKARPSGDTALFDAIDCAANALESWRNQQQRRGEGSPALRIHVLSDGADTNSKIEPAQVARRLQKNCIVLDAVHVGNCQMDKQLHALAKCTGGYVFKPACITDALRLHELEVVLHGPDRAPCSDVLPKVKDDEQLIRQFGPRKFPVDPSHDGALPSRKQPEQLHRRTLPLDAAVSSMQSNSGTEHLESGPERPHASAASMQLSTGPGGSERQRRLLREMRSLMKQPHPNFDVYPCESDIGFWRLVLAMDQAADMFTPYAGGHWLLYIMFPTEYPERPPEVRFVTSVRHCNINAYGRVCHSILDRNYTTDTSVSAILAQVYALVLSPDPDDAVDTSLALQCHNDTEGYRSGISRHVQQHAIQRDRAAWRAELENEPDEACTPALDVTGLGPQTPIAELRRIIVEHALPIRTSGAGRTRCSILQDILEHVATRGNRQSRSQ